MPLLPVTHFEWQVLRTLVRSKKPPAGRALRIVPTRRTKDGTFLTDMVDRGLLARVTGTAEAPFDATYALTERGEHAAEYGECEFPPRTKVVDPVAAGQGSPARRKQKSGRKHR